MYSVTCYRNSFYVPGVKLRLDCVLSSFNCPIINKMQGQPFKTNAPFGVATKKFTKIGFHPELDKSGAMKREITKVGPGSFNPRRHQCKFKQGMRCSSFKYMNFPTFFYCKTCFSWHHKLELEEFSKYLGFRNAHVLQEREFFKTLGGPGGNDVNEDLMKRQSSSQKDNVGFGSGPRLAKCVEGQVAPPPSKFLRFDYYCVITIKPDHKSPSTIVTPFIFKLVSTGGKPLNFLTIR